LGPHFALLLQNGNHCAIGIGWGEACSQLVALLSGSLTGQALPCKRAIPMRLHFLQHVWFEDLAHIGVWADNRDVTVSRTAFLADEQLPSLDDFDWLVIMGGPMGVYDEDQYPWLAGEKKFIEKAMTAGKTVLGICLGAQLIAAASGARVYKNKYKEIGWFDVFRTPEAVESRVFANLPDSFRAFHWHGDTFDLPTRARRLARSQGCANQAFEFDDKLIGLQFHLESTTDSISKLVANCGEEVLADRFVQNTEQIVTQEDYVAEANKLMETLLDSLLLNWTSM
jgi:GMP synthase (glutamine-hydrolysing)